MLPSYKKMLENDLEVKRLELEAHKKNKPIEPTNSINSDFAQQLNKNISNWREELSNIQERIKERDSQIKTLNIDLQEFNKVLQIFKSLEQDLKKYSDSSNLDIVVLQKHNIKTEEVFKYEFHFKKIEESLVEIEEKVNSYKAEREELINKYNTIEKNLNLEIDKLDKPEKDHQNYISNLEEWKIKYKQLEGDSLTEGTLLYFEYELGEAFESLKSEYNEKKISRKTLVNSIFSKKIEIVEEYRKLYQPITQFLSTYPELKKSYDVRFEAALELSLFSDSFLNFIDRTKKGNFREEPYKRLSSLIESTNFNLIEEFSNFLESITHSLQYYQNGESEEEIEVSSQLKKGNSTENVYDFLFKCDYLVPKFSLKLGTKSLEELSPGERGALLLIFYLILDNDDIPLIIDQPEENLDNESVYNILVHFIKKVKEKRQIIIVTHNPNLAVVCDADQIIHMKIEKENKNTVRFYTGGIEDPEINKQLVTILEGTRPAFNNREMKYIR
jgi:DNA repair exonuclease SbcCD ATPase subunit